MKCSRLLGSILTASLLLTGCGGGGANSATSSSHSTPSTVTAVIRVISGVTANPMNNTMQAVVGRSLQLSASGSTDKGSTITAFQWSAISRPQGSSATLGNPNQSTLNFTPDKTGNYTLRLQVTDAQGAVSNQNLSFTVTNVPPTESVVTNVVFNGNTTTTQPTQQVDVGSVITLDASGSVASSGGSLTINWVLASKPATSTVTLPSTGTSVHFTPDVIGEYDIHVIAADVTGAYAEVDYAYQANTPPSAIVVASVSSATSLSATIQAVTNYLVVLDGSSSSAAGDPSNSIWTLVSKPAGSVAGLSALSGLRTNFVPDVAGDYLVTFTFTDTTTGLTSTFTMTIHVTPGPVAIVSGFPTPVAVASGPNFVSSLGVPVTLRGDGSYEVGGATLLYFWQITTKPSGSTASIANPTAVDTTFTPDKYGTYVILLEVSDPSRYVAMSSVTVQVGPYSPVAVLNQTQASVLLGGTVTDSAALSYDPNGNPITFSWSIDAAPAGSVATINGATNTPSLSFTPDVAGTYTLTVTVNNGTLSGNGILTINVFTTGSGTIPLSYEPLREKYNRATDLLFMASANPNALHIVNLASATDTAVLLPAAVLDFAVSPDGTRAAVLHQGVVSVVDVVNGVLLHSWPTNGAQTMVLINNSGLIYLAGQNVGCCSSTLTVIDAGTDATVQTFTSYPALYESSSGVLADASNQIFAASGGVGLYGLALNPATGQVTGGSSSVSGGYTVQCGPLWLSTDESLIFTCNGDYFSTSGLGYVNTLGLGTNPHILSVSDDTNIAEAVVMVGAQSNTIPYYAYPGVYDLYTGSLLFPQGMVPLPLVANSQSYGIAMFHSSGDKHVMVVQTGTNQPNGAGAQYFVLVR